MTAQTDLDAAATQILEIVQGLAAIYRGGPTTVVDNGFSLLPSIAKLIADSQAQIQTLAGQLSAIPIGGNAPEVIAPSDTAVLDGLVGGIYLPNGGLVSLEYRNGFVEPIDFPPRSYFPNCPKRVRATGTDVGVLIHGYFFRGHTPVLITPSDTAVLTGLVGGLYFPNGGTARLEYANGSIETITVGVKGYHPANPKRIFVTGSTADLLVYGYAT